MELQVTGNQSMANRDATAKFVHDVADMEIRAFSMREAANRSREKAKQLENDHKNGKKKLLEGLAISKSAKAELSKDLAEKQKKYKSKKKYQEEYTFSKYCKYDFSGGRLAGFIVLHSFLALIAILSILAVFCWGDTDDSYFIYLALFAAFEICFILIWYNKKKEGYQSEIIRQKSDLISQNNEIKKLEEDLQKINKTIGGAELLLKMEDEAFAPLKARADQIRQKADELDSAATFVEEKIKECYALNVIKPAYQKMVCVTILNDVFVNDKADTMREAMLLCDAEIRHTELIHQLDKVIHSLSILANNLQSIQNVLETINANVSMISQDIFRLSESQEKMADLLENIEGNSKAAAYAAESIKQSADNADFYIAQRRAGSI